MELRTYQTQAINKLRASFIKGKKSLLLVMPTGAGKTVVFAEISKRLVESERKVLILVHRRELIKQAANKLKLIGVSHGIIAAKFKPTNKNIQIASIQTLVRRLDKNEFFPDYIIIDEAHHTAAGSWQKILDYFNETSQSYKIGCTATPTRLDGKGLGDFFEEMVFGPSIRKLIDDKFLAPYKVFAPPLKANLNAVKVVAGDYKKSELQNELNKVDIIGDAVEQYKKHADGLPAIAFCISIKHAQEVCEQFKNAGYKSAVIHGEMNIDDRDEVIKDLSKGKINVLTSVDVISEGTDVEIVSCAILLRPTKSESLYLQQVGRVLRYQENKTAIILDHVNNTRTFGFVDDDRKWDLNSKKRNNRKKNTEGLITVETCKRCFATYKPQPKCPVCSYESQMRQRYIKHEEGQLQELKRVEIETDQKKKLISAARTYEELLQVEKILGYKSGWAYNIHKVRNNGKFAKKTPLFHKGQKLKQTTEGGEVKVSNQNRSFASMKQKGLVAEYIASSPVREYFISSVDKEEYKKNPEYHQIITSDINRNLGAGGLKVFESMLKYKWDIRFLTKYIDKYIRLPEYRDNHLSKTINYCNTAEKMDSNFRSLKTKKKEQQKQKVLDNNNAWEEAWS